MRRTTMILLGTFLLLWLNACAPLRGGLEAPVVRVTGLSVLPTQNLVPTFLIALRVSNPNRVALELEGLVYHLDLEGHRVLSGVAGQLPVIAAYGEEDIRLQVRPDLFSTASLFADLLRTPRESVRFSLETRLDPGGFLPWIKVTKTGELSLAPAGTGGS